MWTDRRRWWCWPRWFPICRPMSCVRASSAPWSVGLGRKVDVGGVRLTLFPGPLPRPGFTLERVTIHEDPRAGIEPLAYVESLGASMRVLSLFQRKLEFSSLNLSDATINLVKTDAGPWNFQFLLENGAANSKRIPAIRMRAGTGQFQVRRYEIGLLFQRRRSGRDSLRGRFDGVAVRRRSFAHRPVHAGVRAIFCARHGGSRKPAAGLESGAGTQLAGRNAAVDGSARVWRAWNGGAGRAAFRSSFASGCGRTNSTGRRPSLGSDPERSGRAEAGVRRHARSSRRAPGLCRPRRTGAFLPW